MVSIGIDYGSRTIKFCLFDLNSGQILSCVKEDNKNQTEEQIDNILGRMLSGQSLERASVRAIVCTGYGRKKYPKATDISSEILCHARGVNYFKKNIDTIIDIGGQDSKIIKLHKDGRVIDFLMNDKCAAGSGRFLERVALFFEEEETCIEDLPTPHSPLPTLEITSTCVVFAESEIISHLAAGEKREEIIRAVYRALVHSVIVMSRGVKIEYPVAFVGGVSLNKGVINAMNEYLKREVYVPPFSDMTGAIGAAITVSGK